jgi:osmotically-inducible protein OsmY
MNNARSVHTAAVADAKADRNLVAGTDTRSPVTTTATRDATKAAAVDKCAQVAGQPSTGCLIDNNNATAGSVTSRAGNTAATMAQRTENAAATAAQKTGNAVDSAAESTRNAAATVADKTERVADTVAAKTANAADKTGDVVADSVITTKVKADIFKEPELKSLGIHVETEKGTVMLSGFVSSKAEADKAVRLAREVNGVTNVKSAIKVK